MKKLVESSLSAKFSSRWNDKMVEMALAEVSQENDWNALLKLEEEQVATMCAEIIAHKPDIVITEKGVSDLAQHYLMKAGIAAFRRLRKTDNNRVRTRPPTRSSCALDPRTC